MFFETQWCCFQRLPLGSGCCKAPMKEIGWDCKREKESHRLGKELLVDWNMLARKSNSVITTGGHEIGKSIHGKKEKPRIK
jgi:hypothetical protein